MCESRLAGVSAGGRRCAVAGESPDGGSGPTQDAAAAEGLLLDLGFSGGLLYAMRQSVAAHAAAAGMSTARTGDMTIAVHELAANAVRHGAGLGRVRIWNTGEALRCEVTDDGPPRAADSTRTRARDSAAWHRDPGHGLWLIRRVADQASVQTGPAGTVATLSFALRPHGERRSFHLAERAWDGYTVMSVSGAQSSGGSRPVSRWCSATASITWP